jgi:hypothetical protein
VRWAAAGLDPIVVPLDAPGFTGYAWTGQIPSGVTTAEIRIIEPRGASPLVVGSVTFSPVDVVAVPLIFLAEAPGELTISDFHITYDSPDTEEPLFRTGAFGPVAHARAVALAAVMTPPPAPPPPPEPTLTDVPGIGERRAEVLATRGIRTIADLAAANPFDIAKLFRGVSLASATSMVEDAKRKLAPTEPVPVGAGT